MREILLAEVVRDSLRVDLGYLAAPTPDYEAIWDRDTAYISRPDIFLCPDRYLSAILGLMDISLSDEIEYRKLWWLISDPPGSDASVAWRFPHAKHDRFGREIRRPWGHKQYDAYGAKLFSVGEARRLGLIASFREDHLRVINLYARMLYVCRFWNDPDFGMWEEGDDPDHGIFRYEVHASSIGAVRAGLAAVVPLLDREEKEMAEEAIGLADRALLSILPRESGRKAVDLALLSLVYPYGIVSDALADEIIRNVEADLLGENGVRRYRGDGWYAEAGSEAEWPMGLYWLSLSHASRGRKEAAKRFLSRGDAACLSDGERLFPELYAGGRYPNEHVPLGWCAAMSILARRAVSGLPF